MFRQCTIGHGQAKQVAFLCTIMVVAFCRPCPVQGQISSDALRQLQAAQTGGDLDQSALASAWREVAAADIEDLPALLAAFDDASPVGVNWLSSALDQVLQRGQANGKNPTSDLLTSYLLDKSNGPRGRETALELLREQSADETERVTAELLHDPVARLRRPAVDALLEQAKRQSDAADQLATYQRAFEFALDEDHVVASAVALRKLGHPVDHIRKFGFLMHWQIIGPFDYQDGDGFDVAHPPEALNLDNYEGPRGIFSDAAQEGKDGPIAWKSYVNTARNGVVDLNKAIDELRDVMAYGATVFESESEQQVELRLRQQNSAKLWLNGQLVFSQPIGHTGNSFDQYTVPVKLQRGPNLIVVKSCQWAGPVEHPFMAAWQFGVRVCDATGNAILAANRPPTPELDPVPSPEPAEDPESDANKQDTEDDVTGNEPADGDGSL